MATRISRTRAVPSAARVFSDLQAGDALLPGEASALRRSGALFLALLVLAAAPLFWAANAAGLIGDVPAAVAHSGNSGPGGGDDDDDRSGPGDGDGDDDDSATLKTDNTSATAASTLGTTNDNDTATKLGTDDTSANGHSTRGTTNDNDTRTKLGTDDTSANGETTKGTTADNDTRTATGTNTGGN
jgi:hypothetical protein